MHRPTLGNFQAMLLAALNTSLKSFIRSCQWEVLWGMEPHGGVCAWEKTIFCLTSDKSERVPALTLTLATGRPCRACLLLVACTVEIWRKQSPLSTNAGGTGSSWTEMRLLVPSSKGRSLPRQGCLLLHPTGLLLLRPTP